MAEAAVMEPQTESPPPFSGPPKNPKGGRPPGYKPFNNEVTPEDFFVMLNAIDDADWPKSLVYVWRRDPFTDNTNGGREPKYVDVINRAVTEGDIKEEHGSGTYKLQLNTNDKYVAHTILSLEDPKFPPHVPPGDWFNNPRNKKWATWKPLVEKWWADKLKAIAGPQTTAAPENGAALQELTRLVSQLANKNGQSSEGDKISATLVQWALQQTAEERKSERDADSPDKLVQLIRAAKELNPPAAPAPQDNTLITFLLEEVKSMREQTTLLLTKMFDMKTEGSKQPTPGEQMKQMADIMATVSGFIQPAAPKEPWQEVATELGPRVLSVVEQGITAFTMANRVRPNPNPAQPQPQQHAPQPQQQAAAPLPAPVQTQPEPQGGPEIDTMQRSMILQVAGLAHNAMTVGLSGDQFAEQVCTSIFNDKIYEQFIGAVAKDQLLPLFRSIPEAWAVLQPFEPQLVPFIEAFYAYGEEPPEEEPALKPEVVPPPKAKSVSKKK